MARLPTDRRQLVVWLGGVLAVALLAGMIAIGALAIGSPRVPTLDDGIQNERALIAAGLSGAPPPGQPTQPFAVDRVLVDGANTWVHYRQTAGTWQSFMNAAPAMYDGRGDFVGGPSTCYSRESEWFPPRWFPWHPPARLICVAQLAPLPATARGALLRFDLGPGYGRHSSAGAYAPVTETVWVPLDLHALGRRHTIVPDVTATAQGLSVTLMEVTNSPFSGELRFTFWGANNFVPVARIVTAQGRSVAVTHLSMDCEGVCTTSGTFAPLPRGARVTLTVTTIRLNGVGARRLGPWRFTIVMP